MADRIFRQQESGRVPVIADLMADLMGGMLPIGRSRGPVAKHNARLRERGCAEIGVRVVAGEIPGLGQEFTVGCWSVAPGALLFRTVFLSVDSVDPSSRAPSMRESNHLYARSRVLSATSGDVAAELAIQETEIEWVLARLRGAPVAEASGRADEREAEGPGRRKRRR